MENKKEKTGLKDKNGREILKFLIKHKTILNYKK